MEPTSSRLPRRQLIPLVSSLVAVILLSWWYLWRAASDMSAMGADTGGVMSMAMPAGAEYLLMLFLMWAIMMVAMMLPSALPMILIYAGVARNAIARDQPIAATLFFVLGYILVWTGFSALATWAHYYLERLGLVDPMMVLANPLLGAAMLVMAGTYQWLPFKDQCLQHCRSPAFFIASHWRPGAAGAIRMGITHGLFCLGCCWLLMCLLFVGGVMNLLWIALLTAVVLVEKLLPFGVAGGRMLGVILIFAGFVWWGSI
jgi:predicted metal-binding membrane protein